MARMRYFVRYIYDEDDDGYPADIDYDDENPLLTIDLDGDGLDVYNDCDDSNASENTGDCDGDGIPIWNDCNDEDPNIWEMDEDCDNDGFLIEEDCDDKKSNVGNTGHTGLSEVVQVLIV